MGMTEENAIKLLVAGKHDIVRACKKAGMGDLACLMIKDAIQTLQDEKAISENNDAIESVKAEISHLVTRNDRKGNKDFVAGYRIGLSESLDIIEKFIGGAE